uniref:Putative Response regulator receiver protein n=1 Tax=mine drainage metagenome TaxID=410659 RepID=E6QID1_9ZZZZ
MQRLIRPKVSMATILLVDENPLRASLRQSILERAVPDVVRVSEPAEALCLVESVEFARTLRLVITGNHLTGITGPEFVSELRARMPRVPVLVLMNNEEKQAKENAQPGVSYSYANSPEELRATVDDLLNKTTRQSA